MLSTTLKFLLFTLYLTVAFSTSRAAHANIILQGRVVTMNDAGDVLPDARVWLRDGKIAAVFKHGERLPIEAKGTTIMNTKGVIYPGMIDLHNHPEYAHYPLLPVTRKY